MYTVFESLLKSFDTTAAAVCRATGIKEQTISNWKRRGGSLRGDNLKKIADYFGVSVEYLMTGEEVTDESIFMDDANSDVRELALFLFRNPEYKVLFDACQKVKRDDIRFVQKVIERVSR